MTTLSESNEKWPPDRVPGEEVDGHDQWLLWLGMTMGAAEALDVNLAAHTNGKRMGIVNLSATPDTAPPRVDRSVLETRQDVAEAFRHRIQSIEDWPEDTKNWRPGPFDYPDHFDGEVERE